MSDQRKPFPFADFEPQWQKYWAENQTFRTPNPGDADFDATKPKYYILDMFPYPSGAGLHVGHPEGYTATDILGRFKKMNNHNVLHPMGWDAFGLPAEQYAIKTGQHPRITTEANILNFRRQLQSLGFGYDWSREVNTTDPQYVRWTQWIFLQLYNSYFNEETQKAAPISELEAKGWTREQIDDERLAFIHEAPVNWSPDLGTVLANEEIEEWKSKGHTVERRPLRQWMLRITKYAQRLIDELDPLDWPDSIKMLQTNWIGKSTGAEVTFDLDGHDVTVFTTRPDTLFGATYMVLAPEHPLVSAITTTDKQEAVDTYIKGCASKSDLERGDLNKDKSGIFTGAYATNPVNGEKIPVWIADYVMMSYGTGAIMAVPGHDTRDFEFATKFGLPVLQVVQEGSVGVPPAQQGNVGVSPAQQGNVGVSPAFFNQEQSVTTTHHKLPHWQQNESAVFVTWRLADSLPQEKLNQIESEQKLWLSNNVKPWSKEQTKEYHQLFSDRINDWLDQGYGSCALKETELAQITLNALKHFDRNRYNLHSAIIMPNHVHVLFSPKDGHQLGDIVQSWKSFTSKEINRKLDTSGTFWQAEYYDRLIRSQKHFDRVTDYIVENPLKAGLSEGRYLLYSAQVDQSAGERSTSNSATGSSLVSVTGVSPSPSFGTKKPATTWPFPSPNSPCSSQRWTTSNPLDPPKAHSPKRPTGLTTRKPPAAKPTPCPSGRARAGITCATAIPTTPTASSPKRPKLTGVARPSRSLKTPPAKPLTPVATLAWSTSTSAAPSTPSSTSSTPDSGTRSSTTSVTSAPKNRSKNSSTKG